MRRTRAFSIMMLNRGLVHWAPWLSNMLPSVRCLWLVLPLCLIQCKKDDETGPTTYHLSVVDECTGVPVGHAWVVLENWYWPAATHHDTLGQTADDGNFDYVFDKEPSDEVANYSNYSLLASRDDYWVHETYDELVQDHGDHEVTLEVFKEAVLSVKATRIGANEDVMFNFVGEYPLSQAYHGLSSFDMGETKSWNETVPSCRTVMVRWYTGGQPITIVPVQCGYADTTICEIFF